MEYSFMFFILFFFVLIALFIFILFFVDQLREIRGHFKWRHSVPYLLGSVFILVGLSLAYFVYHYFSATLAVILFILLNGAAIFFLRRASATPRREK